jgi:hypothetical protein
MTSLDWGFLWGGICGWAGMGLAWWMTTRKWWPR